MYRGWSEQDEENSQQTEAEFLAWIDGVIVVAILVTIGYLLYHIGGWALA